MVKLSVKKPLTVMVAVIIVIALGVVSFMNMTPDLLPSMELPYVVLVTTYPGATPERVEAAVTRPLEQSMATLENISDISSTSRENASVIFLEFSSDVNLEAVTVDILQKVSQVEGYWEETVGTPLILKLNPDMIPVVVSSVEMDGMSATELSALVEETLLYKLEAVPGVARINVSGTVRETVNAVLNQEKIDRKNEEITAAILSQFSDAERELLDTQTELESNLSEVESNIKKLENGLGALASQAGASGAEITAKQRELLEGRLLINEQLAELNRQLSELLETEKLVGPLIGMVAQMTMERDRAAAAAAQLEADLLLLQSASAGAALTGEERAALEARYAGLPAIDAAALMQLLTVEQMKLAAVTENLAQIEAQLAAPPLSTDLNGLGGLTEQLAAGKAALQGGMSQLETALRDLESGELALSQAMTQLESVKVTSQYELAQGAAQLNLAQSQLDAGLKQVDSGIEQLRDARETALEAASLNKILTMDTLSMLLKAQNFSMPAGYAEQDGVSYLVRVDGAVRSMEELQGVVLADTGIDGVAPVRLEDVADVFIADNLDTLYAKINGKDGVLLSFNKQSTYSTADVSDRLNAEFDKLCETYSGLRFTPLMDQGRYIYIVINSILSSLGFGAIFAIIILFLFLKDLRPTFITLCSIPISVLFAVVLMYFSGVTLNIISLSGLAVAVGMLVDNSIVVIENIFRLRGKGIPAVQAAVAGTKQVAGAIAASTLTTVCVFLPIVFVTGITRDLFTDMALTIGYSLMASLIVALTLVPAMASGLFRRMEPREVKLLGRALRVYKRALDWSLRRKAVVLILSVALLAGSAALVWARGFIFMPSGESTQLMIELELPDKAGGFDRLRDVSEEVVGMIEDVDGITDLGVMVGSSGIAGTVGLGGLSGDSGASSTTVIYAMLEPGKGVAAESEIRGRLRDLPYTISIMGMTSMNMDMMSTGGITVDIYCNDTDVLLETARRIAAELATVEGIAEVDSGAQDTTPEIRFIVDREKAMAHELTVAQVFSEVSSALKTEINSTTVTYSGRDYTVTVVDGGGDLTPDFVKDITIAVTKRDGTEETVALRDIAEIIDAETASAIQRSNQRRYIQVTAEVGEDYNITLVAGEAERKLSALTLPQDVSYELTGESETIWSAFKDLFWMLAMGVLLVYLIMVAQFQSLKSPFIVMFTIPLAFTGGLAALLITGHELSVVAIVGFVMLVGVIVNNGIVLVDYINQLRLEGMGRAEAITEAGVTRMRPILMTSLTTILGLIVMALGTGTGSEMMQPVAIVCIGGLLYATFMTLFVVPVIYDMMNKRELSVVSDEELNYTEDGLTP